MTVKPGVVVVHPGKQHSYQVVFGLQKAGLLQRFLTSVYYKPGKLPYSLVTLLPSKQRTRAVTELRKRRAEGVDEKLVASIPTFELVSRTVGRLPYLARRTEGRSTYEIADWVSDVFVSRWLRWMKPRPTMLYSFLGSSVRSIREAKRIGIPTVLDVPIVLDANRIVSQEKRVLGMRTRLHDLGAARLQEVLTADYVVTPSTATAHSVVDRGVSPERVFVVPFGVDTGRFQPPTRDEQVSQRPFRALFIGKFDLRKGVHYLLEAWQHLNLPNAELTIVGPEAEPPFAQIMRAKYAGFFREAGNVPHHELARLYAGADIFVFPSLAEGSALVTYEALAAGLPSIVTAEAGSVVRDGVEGFVIPRADCEALKDRITRLYHDSDLRQRMSRAARRRAEEFDWAQYHDSIADLARAIIGNCPNTEQGSSGAALTVRGR